MKQGYDLSIKESYVQKIVPGTQETLPSDFLYLTLNSYNLGAVFIDSIYYMNRSYPIKKSKLQYKIDLSKGVVMTNTSKAENLATVFYSQHNKIYYLRTKGVMRKETLYLP